MNPELSLSECFYLILSYLKKSVCESAQISHIWINYMYAQTFRVKHDIYTPNFMSCLSVNKKDALFEALFETHTKMWL